MKRRQDKIGPIHHSTEDYRRVYLKSNHWKQLRAIKRSKNPVCQICGRGKSPDVHHLFYGELYNVRLDWLVTLCRKCHTKVHELKLAYDPDFQWFSGPCRKNRERYETMEQMFLDKVHDRLKKPKEKSKSKSKSPAVTTLIGYDLLKQMDEMNLNGKMRIFGMFKCQPVSSFAESHFRNLPISTGCRRIILRMVRRYRDKHLYPKHQPGSRITSKERKQFRKENRESLRRIKEQKSAMPDILGSKGNNQWI